MPRQHQIVPRRDVGLPAGFDQRRSAGFTQDGGTGDAIAGAQLVTPVQGRIMVATRNMHRDRRDGLRG